MSDDKHAPIAYRDIIRDNDVDIRLSMYKDGQLQITMFHPVIISFCLTENQASSMSEGLQHLLDVRKQVS